MIFTRQGSPRHLNSCAVRAKSSFPGFSGFGFSCFAFPEPGAAGTDARERLIQFKTNIDVAMSVLDKNGLGDWLADRLVEIGEEVKDEFALRIDAATEPCEQPDHDAQAKHPRQQERFVCKAQFQALAEEFGDGCKPQYGFYQQGVTRREVGVESPVGEARFLHHCRHAEALRGHLGPTPL